jgi:regulator of sigma E protease
MFIGYILPFLVVFTILVFVHEFGHYWVAKKFGVTIETFSIGFGPEIFGWTDKAGTRWKISIIPFGGYVKYLGDADASSRPDNETIEKLTQEEKSKTMHSKPPFQRLLIAAAGPIANYILAVVVFFLLFATIGQRYVPAKISQFTEQSAAQEAGLQVGDIIKSINGNPIKTFLDIEKFVKGNSNVPLNMLIDRSGQEMSLTVAPKETEEESSQGEKKKVGRLGIVRSPEINYIQHNVLTAFVASITETLSFSCEMLSSIGQMIMGKKSADDLGGVIRIGNMMGQASQMGLPTLIWIMAIFSINLGLFNLFPIPALDGGHILFYAVEMVRGKPIPSQIQERAFMVGLFIILSLMIYVNANDLVHFKVFSWVQSFFS